MSATGALYAGHDAVDGRPVEALIEVARQGGLSVLVSAWTSQQAHTSTDGIATPFDVLVDAAVVLESVQWPHQNRKGSA